MPRRPRDGGRIGKAVLVFLSVDPQPLELGDHGLDAIGLLVADVGDIPNPRRAVRENGDRSQRLGRVADVVHVDVDASQRAALNGDRRIAPTHRAAHLFEHIDEANVPSQ